MVSIRIFFVAQLMDSTSEQTICKSPLEIIFPMFFLGYKIRKKNSWNYHLEILWYHGLSFFLMKLPTQMRLTLKEGTVTSHGIFMIEVQVWRMKGGIIYPQRRAPSSYNNPYTPEV